LPLDIEKRKRIYEAIKKNPGLHFRELIRILDINVGDLQYNLSVLEKENLIVGKEEMGYKRYYPNPMEFPQEKKILPYLRQPVQRSIIVEILMNGKESLTDISRNLNLKNQTILYHIKKMESSGILLTEKEGKNVFYFIKDPELVSRTLIKYKESFSDKIVERFIEFWRSTGKI